MKVVIYGQDHLMGRISRALIAQGDSVVVTENKAEVAGLVDADNLSLAVIDMTAPNAKDVCGFIKEKLDLPIIIVLGFGEGGWKVMDDVPAEGYIHRTVTESELTARLKAVARRLNRVAAQ